MGDRESAVGDERVDDLLGVDARGARVPERQRGDAVAVDVFGCPLEFRERRDRQAAPLRVRVIDLEEQRLVGLNDQRTVDRFTLSLAVAHVRRARRARRG